MFGFILRYADERLIKKYSSEMPIQLKMRFKDQQIFSQDQVAQVLQITRSGSGLPKHIKREKYAYAMFCAESEFAILLPNYDYEQLRQRIITVLLLGKNDKSLSLLCLINNAKKLDSKYLSSLKPSSVYDETGSGDSGFSD